MTNYIPESYGVPGLLIERKTQTWNQKSKLLDTSVTVSTQTPVKGLHLLEERHQFISSKPYNITRDTANEVIQIQRWWKHMLKRKQILSYLEDLKNGLKKFDERENRIEKENEKLRAKLDISIESLTSDEDFAHIYSKIEMEKNHLVKLAKANYSGHLLTLAHLFIVLQEIEQIRKVEIRRGCVKEKIKLKSQLATLKQVLPLMKLHYNPQS